MSQHPAQQTAFLLKPEQLSCPMSPISQGHGEEDARMSQTPTAQLGKGCRTVAELTLRAGPPPALLWAARPRARRQPQLWIAEHSPL